MRYLRGKLKQARENQKGFTLIEVVVVLVIIAILATLMIGALNGYIDMAKEKRAMSNCRSVVIAGNTVGAEAYASRKPASKADIAELAGVPASSFTIRMSGSNAQVLEVSCEEGGKRAHYVFNPSTNTSTMEISAASVSDALYTPTN